MADHRTKWDEDNASSVNPGAIVAAGVLIIFLVGLGLLFALT
jgi:preprotein translocase subunit Sec61beta